MASLQLDLKQLFVLVWYPSDSAPAGAELLYNALERCEGDVIRIKKSIAAVEEALISRVSPFLDTTPIFSSVDVSLILRRGPDIPEAPTFMSLGPFAPMSLEACDAMNMDAHAVIRDSPSGAPVSFSTEEESVDVST